MRRRIDLAVAYKTLLIWDPPGLSSTRKGGLPAKRNVAAANKTLLSWDPPGLSSTGKGDVPAKSNVAALAAAMAQCVANDRSAESDSSPCSRATVYRAFQGKPIDEACIRLMARVLDIPFEALVAEDPAGNDFEALLDAPDWGWLHLIPEHQLPGFNLREIDEAARPDIDAAGGPPVRAWSTRVDIRFRLALSPKLDGRRGCYALIHASPRDVAPLVPSYWHPDNALPTGPWPHWLPGAAPNDWLRYQDSDWGDNRFLLIVSTEPMPRLKGFWTRPGAELMPEHLEDLASEVKGLRRRAEVSCLSVTVFSKDHGTIP